MEKVKVRGSHFELVIFYQQVLDKAITVRLFFAQKESNNYQALEDELPNLWEVAQKKLPAEGMESCLGFSRRTGAFSRSARVLVAEFYFECLSF